MKHVTNVYLPALFICKLDINKRIRGVNMALVRPSRRSGCFSSLPKAADNTLHSKWRWSRQTQGPENQEFLQRGLKDDPLGLAVWKAKIKTPFYVPSPELILCFTEAWTLGVLFYTRLVFFNCLLRSCQQSLTHWKKTGMNQVKCRCLGTGEMARTGKVSPAKARGMSLIPGTSMGRKIISPIHILNEI